MIAAMAASNCTDTIARICRNERNRIEKSSCEGRHSAQPSSPASLWKMPTDPAGDIGHHGRLAGVVEEIVEVAIIELEGFVLGAGGVVEELAAARLGGLVT